MAVQDLTDQELMAGKSANDLYQAISQGVGDQMPAFSDKLSEAERWALADYLRSLTFASGSGCRGHTGARSTHRHQPHR